MSIPLLLAFSATDKPKVSVPSVAQSDASCAKCHQAIYDRYLKTSMANASGDAMSAFVPGSFHHEASNINYRVYSENGEAWMSYERPGTPLSGKRHLELFVGSAHRGRTYLFRTEDWWFEIPINFYSSTHSYEMAPNWQSLTEMPLNQPVDSGCLHCHASDVQLEMPGTMSRYATLPFLKGGITCESCHGDTAEHVRTNGKSPVIDPNKLTADRRDAICYRCHLEGETNVTQPGRSPAEFRPGDRLEDFVTYFIHEGAPDATKRSVSEVETFNLSKCKLTSGSKMTCTTCHDPHSDPTPAERVEFYRARCTTCHSQQKFLSLKPAIAHHPEQRDCTVCHMPRVSTADVAHSQTTDHRIPRIPGEYAAAPVLMGIGDLSRPLVPVPGTTASERDRAVATFDLIATGDKSAQAESAPLLRAALAKDPKDTQVLVDLGWLSQAAGDRRKAAEYYADALQVNPLQREAATNLGVLYGESDDLPRAAAQLEKAFRNTPFIPELGKNLARVYCSEGRREDTKNTLDRLLEFDPDGQSPQRMRERLVGNAEACTQPAH